VLLRTPPTGSPAPTKFTVIEEEEIGRIVGVFVVVGRFVGEIRLGDRVYDGLEMERGNEWASAAPPAAPPDS
jgi:hypothetical protein